VSSFASETEAMPERAYFGKDAATVKGEKEGRTAKNRQVKGKNLIQSAFISVYPRRIPLLGALGVSWRFACFISCCAWP
jgi:hypothetical protein